VEFLPGAYLAWVVTTVFSRLGDVIQREGKASVGSGDRLREGIHHTRRPTPIPPAHRRASPPQRAPARVPRACLQVVRVAAGSEVDRNPLVRIGRKQEKVDP